MSRYTDVDRLLLELSDLIDEFSELDENGLHSERWCGIMDSKGIIINAPSIDIVRCKECKHREEYPCKVYHDDDWYCANGERREQ